MRRVAALVTLVLALTACSGGQEATPEELSQVQKQLTSTTSPLGMPLQEKQASCVAKIYLEADFSPATRNAILDGQPIAPRDANDQNTLNDITKKIADDCLSS
jgi:PBP1b-binding outer membrane lipoprotein LpoB